MLRLILITILAGCTTADAVPDARDAPQAPAVHTPSPQPEPCDTCSCVSGDPSNMTLPFSANTTYAAGSQIKSADLNDFQTQIIDNIGDLITALGGSSPDTLVDMIAHGTFTPVLAASASPAFTYGSQVGSYLRIGPWVHARFLLAWTNNDAGENTNPAVIVPPYAAEASTTWTGVFDYTESDIGTAGTTITTAAVRLSAALGGIQIAGRATNMNSSIIGLAYGTADARTVAGAIWYKTDGTFNY